MVFKFELLKINLKMSWGKIHTRNDGFSVPCFYRSLLKGECTSACRHHQPVHLKRVSNFCMSELTRKINYCVVKKLTSKRYGLNSIRCHIDITNRQYNALVTKFALTAKFKYFCGFIAKMNIVTEVFFGARPVRIDTRMFLIKVISKPKVTFSDGSKNQTLTDGKRLYISFKKF
jgi:hypothetical protein